MKNYLFTSESVSEGHPDKVADQISDAVLDEFLRQDPDSRVACETFCTTGLVVVGGEVHSDKAYVNIQDTVRKVINGIGYDKASYMFDGNSRGVLSAIHAEQSGDISRGVARGRRRSRAQETRGMMFGYACKESPEYMPLPIYLSHPTLRVLSDIRKQLHELMPYLRPDSKTQYTAEYDGEYGTSCTYPHHSPLYPARRVRGRSLGLHEIRRGRGPVRQGQGREGHARQTERDVREILIPGKCASSCRRNVAPLQRRIPPVREPDRQVRDRRSCRRHRPDRQGR